MARKATKAASSNRGKGETKSRSSGTSVARRSSASSGGGSRSQEGMGDAFIKLLQSPLVAELVAVAATAALAALAEHGFTTGGEGSRDCLGFGDAVGRHHCAGPLDCLTTGGEGSRGKRAGKAVKQAGKAAAAAIGRRLANELEEIRRAAKDGAKA